MYCHICAHNSIKIFTGEILNKYSCQYYKCTQCGFIQTEKPYWLAEAYSKAIADLDIGLVSRNIEYSKILERIILNIFQYNKACLDFAGGYGLLVRIMRDKGFDFYRQDKYCENIFSKGFGLENTTVCKFELLTAFEVFEHLENPLEEIKEMFQYSDNILFSTEIIPNKTIKDQNDWWYFVPQTGQHISFYSLESLQAVASVNNCRFYSNGKNLHLFSKKELNKNPFDISFYSLRYKIIPFIDRMVDILYKKKKGIHLSSKTDQDFDLMRPKTVLDKIKLDS